LRVACGRLVPAPFIAPWDKAAWIERIYLAAKERHLASIVDSCANTARVACGLVPIPTKNNPLGRGRLLGR
jgi:hypothetical protein